MRKWSNNSDCNITLTISHNGGFVLPTGLSETDRPQSGLRPRTARICPQEGRINVYLITATQSAREFPNSALRQGRRKLVGCEIWRGISADFTFVW